MNTTKAPNGAAALTGKDAKESKRMDVTISAPRFELAVFHLEGTAPLLQAAFSAKTIQAIRTKHEAGSTARSKKVREARDFDEDASQAAHRATEGWFGLPASCFRNAMISACRLVGFKMTIAKLSVFVEPDGFDAVSGLPLVRLDVGDYEVNVMAARNATGVVDLRSRPMWRKWACKVRVTFDADQFTLADVTNLMARCGQQVGIGEGRPDSRESAGMGFGTFRVGVPS